MLSKAQAVLFQLSDPRKVTLLFSLLLFALALAAMSLLPVARHQSAAGSSFAEVVDKVYPKVVKIYGAGGFRGLESYQSGSLISATVMFGLFPVVEEPISR